MIRHFAHSVKGLLMNLLLLMVVVVLLLLLLERPPCPPLRAASRQAAAVAAGRPHLLLEKYCLRQARAALLLGSLTRRRPTVHSFESR